MTDRSSNKATTSKQSALVKLSISTPKISAGELKLWLKYLEDTSASRSCTPSNSVTKEDAEHSELLQNFKNYYISNQVEFTNYNTVIYVLRTFYGMSVRSEYHMVDCLRLSDIENSRFPKVIVALYHQKLPENGEPYFDRTLFVKEPLKEDSKDSMVRGQQLGARFLLIAEDLGKQILYRFYVPGGQNGGPLYGQYVQDDALGSIDIEQVNQGEGNAVVWRKRESPLEDLGTEERKHEPPLQKSTTEEWERNNIALRHIVEKRRLYVKSLLESHESSAGMRNSGQR